MKTIMNPDNWVEIPAGEFLTGLSQEQRQAIVSRILEQAGYSHRPEPERLLLDSAAQKLGMYPRVWLSEKERNALGFSKGEAGWPYAIEEDLPSVPPQQSVHTERFYISRYPITELQYSLYTHGTRATDLPDVREEPETRISEAQGAPGEIYGRWVAPVQIPEALALCRDLGGRLPSSVEWERAGRGTDGRLYPWGDVWRPDAGFFHYDELPWSGIPGRGRSVTSFPTGVSPYGVWAMAGGLPELVTVSTPRPGMTRKVKSEGKALLVDIKGCHAKESSEEWAWFDHILALPGRGFWVSFRPVLDDWPKTQWTGARPGESR